jgi:P-type E1-E2 ATPase
VIEKAASVDFAVLDKTGTITEGKPELSASFGIGISQGEALRLAGSLERRSEHSLGRAIVDSAHDVEPFEVSGFSAVPGRGIQGIIEGKATLIGSRAFIEQEGIKGTVDAVLGEERRGQIGDYENAGSTVIFLCCDGNLRGIFVISDKVRQEAAEAISMLSSAGIGVSMVTGDNPGTAESVARKTGIQSVKAQVSPLDKAEEIRRLENLGKHVLMAGDGINDAPALVQATVGVAMGRATDIALESADIVVMRSDLRLIADAVALAKKTFSVIRQNIFWAFFYNSVVIPLAIFGVLHPIIAAGAMAFSSLSVVGNSMRARIR